MRRLSAAAEMFGTGLTSLVSDETSGLNSRMSASASARLPKNCDGTVPEVGGRDGDVTARDPIAGRWRGETWSRGASCDSPRASNLPRGISGSENRDDRVPRSDVAGDGGGEHCGLSCEASGIGAASVLASPLAPL